MPMPRYLHPDAPPKPAVGEPCNGCGLCCLAGPCPLGIVLARQVRGPCALLRWSDEQQRYLCAAVSPPATGWASALRAALARRWIASGQGCDAELQADPADTP